MVGPTQQMESSAPPPPQQPQTATASAEEEALKRNTDCVYFLASPLTCKKGSECEYRHSDIARVNPRDCYYWLNSNCLNPKCAFRHPPLDGLLGTQAPSSASSAVPPLQAASTPIPNASTKQGVACIFFQKGYCLKGDWCPFLHGPIPLSNKNTQVATMSTADPASFKNTFAGPEKSTQEKKVSSKTVEKSFELPSNEKPAGKVEPAQPRAEPEFAASKKTLTTWNVNDEFPSYGPTSVSPANNGRQASRSIHVHQQPHQLEEHGSMNSKDIEEISREPSPGFDVLVDNELRDSDYYPGEDQYAMSGDHEGRNEYDIAHSADYNSMVDVDRDMYRDPRGYESYERLQGYTRDPHRASSERMSVGSGYQRRRRDSVNSPDRVGERDLRHRLSKHRRGNGLRSVITHEYARDRHVEDKGHKVTGREAQYLPPSESSLSSRLRGRIKLPLRSSSPHDHGRSSFGRTQHSTHPGRLRDRIKGRDEDGFNIGGRTRGRREMKADDVADFAGPKSLSELKSKKNVEIGEQQSLGKRKHSSLDGYQQIGGDLSFEGPKPLVEILKQKRGETTNNDDNNQKEEKSGKMMKITSTVEDQCDSKSASGDNGGAEKYGSSDGREVEAEGEMVVEDQLDEQENVAYEQRDGASDDYEQVEGEYYDDIDEGENGEAEDEYPDDEDGDDFAKKMGVMYS